MSSDGVDRMLLLIVGGVLLLLLLALGSVLFRAPPTYRSEESPEAAVHNYVLALQQTDWDRAWSLLDPELPGAPLSAGQFAADLLEQPWQLTELRESTLNIDEVIPLDGERVLLLVRRRTMSRQFLFEPPGTSITERYETVRRDAGWRLSSGTLGWQQCWSLLEGCATR